MTEPQLGRILVVDDEAELLAVLSEKLTQQGYHVVSRSGARAALGVLQEQAFDLLLTDMMMPEMDGVALVRAAVQTDPHLAAIIMTGQATVQTAVEALKIGVLDYLLKPFKTPALLSVLARALEIRRLRLENIQLREAAAIDELCKTISFTTDLNTILNKIADAAVQQCDADEVSIMLPTADEKELCISAVKGADRGALLGERVPINQAVAGWVARTREPLTLEGEVHDARFAPIRPREDIRSSVSMPMLVGGRLVGILNVNSTRRRRPRTLGEVKALGILASAGAAAIEGALLLARLHESEAMYRSIFENAVAGISQTSPSGEFRAVNLAFACMLGYDSPAELCSKVSNSGLLYKSQADRSEFEQRLVKQGVVEGFETCLVRRDGRPIWVSQNGRTVLDHAGRIAGFDFAVIDVSDQKKAEQRFRTIVESAPDAMVIIDERGEIVLVNSRIEQLFGYSRDELLGKPVEFLMPERYRDRHAAHRTQFFAQPRFRSMGEGRELYGQRKSGEEFPVEISLSPLETEDGTLISGAIRDITARKRADEVVRENEERLRQLAENLEEVIWLGSPDGLEILYVSPSYEKVWGRSCASLYANPWSWVEAIHHEDRPRVLAAAKRRIQGELYLQEYRVVHPDGAVRLVRDRAFPIRDGAGNVCRIAGVAEDVTQQRLLEDQLRQAQKMEAVGHLAGGVAHDFNNHLTIITGCSEVLLQGLPADNHSRRLLTEIRSAGERSAALTRQLLFFSRKQIVAPRVLDLNEVVADAEKLLRRLIGEDVEMTVSFAAGLGTVIADPGHIHQVLLNLVVNARDAMPRGGKLTIETRSVDLDEGYTRMHAGVQPGPYALLAVSDTGCGLTAEVKARLFEPFFTTKAPGKGTGFGLATVFGIVKQAEGTISVYSEPGLGATFKIYLPRTDRPAGKSVSGMKDPPRGIETVLLVEDDDSVRALGRHVLAGCGYTLIEASDGEEALRTATSRQEPIHLLVTDVVMPGLGGRELAERLLALHPDVKVLYLSGYTDDAVVRHGILHEDVNFLQKPYSTLALAHKVREVLDGR